MNVLLFEWLSGGGLWLDGLEPDPNDSLQHQGIAMAVALAEDLQRSGCQVNWMLDERWLPQLSNGLAEAVPIGPQDSLNATLQTEANRADRVLLIAPETQGRLATVVEQVPQEKLISPGSSLVALASHKQQLHDDLLARGLPLAAEGCLLSDLLPREKASWPHDWPTVIKPVDGAGSEGVRLLKSLHHLQTHELQNAEHYRLERWIPGTAASVSLIAHPQGICWLPPLEQILDKPLGHYLDARETLSPDMQTRAQALVAAALPSLPDFRGYIGCDLVLHPEDPTQDRLIEINPRLTMSYLRQRELAAGSLTDWMLYGEFRTASL